MILEYLLIAWLFGLTIICVMLIQCQSNQADLLRALNDENEYLKKTYRDVSYTDGANDNGGV